MLHPETTKAPSLALTAREGAFRRLGGGDGGGAVTALALDADRATRANASIAHGRLGTMSEEPYERAWCPDCHRNWYAEDGVMLPHAKPVNGGGGRCPGSGQPATLPPRQR